MSFALRCFRNARLYSQYTSERRLTYVSLSYLRRKIMLKRILSLAILCAAAPLAAWADQPAASPFGYTYAEGGYLSENPSGGGSDLTGVFVDGSYELQPHWRLTGDFSNASCCGSTDNRYG